MTLSAKQINEDLAFALFEVLKTENMDTLQAVFNLEEKDLINSKDFQNILNQFEKVDQILTEISEQKIFDYFELQFMNAKDLNPQQRFRIKLLDDLVIEILNDKFKASIDDSVNLCYKPTLFKNSYKSHKLYTSMKNLFNSNQTTIKKNILGREMLIPIQLLSNFNLKNCILLSIDKTPNNYLKNRLFSLLELAEGYAIEDISSTYDINANLIFRWQLLIDEE